MESSTSKLEYRIRDVPTRSVTLFPSRAQVVRELKAVPLQHGSTEITITGLTPTVDEHSIKVEGVGSNAIITDIAIELLPNRELFQDIYPDSDDESEVESDKDDSDDDDDGSPEAEEKKSVERKLVAVDDRLTALQDTRDRVRETLASAAARLKILDGYLDQLKPEDDTVPIEKALATYEQERANVFSAHMSATVQDRGLGKDIAKACKEQSRLNDDKRRLVSKMAKKKRQAVRAKEQETLKARLRLAEKRKEKDRVRREREQFWPRSCYTVRITLENAPFTPSSSRRGSIASASELVKPSADDGSRSVASDHFDTACDILLSYVTSSAFWSPRYDLVLSTTANTGRLCFDAALTNMTSEVWSNCKITLSNSQTTFSFGDGVIPTLKPWHVRLAGKNTAMASGILHSREEQVKKDDWSASKRAHARQPVRAQLFGVSDTSAWVGKNQVPQPPVVEYVKTMRAEEQPRSLFGQPSNAAPSQGGGLFGTSRPFQPGQSQAGALFGSAQSSIPAPRASGLFGTQASAIPPPPAPSGSPNAPTRAAFASINPVTGADNSNDILNDYEVDSATILEAEPELAFQESSFEETGLTATYDLPGLKTLKQSTTPSKQRVAQVAFANVVFSRTVVAKYTPVAYLKAQIRNASPLGLLPGPTGLTLDGTFLGRSSLPRCSAGAVFTLSLGTDPALQVSYPAPDVRRSTAGMFSKEDSTVYTRTVTLRNTRAGAGAKPVALTVLDQVPVSEDEKLRVGVLHPRGLRAGGEAVATGTSGREGEKEWGRATATLKKAGEVAWDVVLNAGKSVKLTLEYEVVLPTGEHVTQC